MAISATISQRVSPVRQTDRTGARRRETVHPSDHEATVDVTPTANAIELHADPEPRRRDEPARPHIPGTLAAQLIAQKLPTKSDRRLARYFPERVHHAYREAASVMSEKRIRRSA